MTSDKQARKGKKIDHEDECGHALRSCFDGDVSQRKLCTQSQQEKMRAVLQVTSQSRVAPWNDYFFFAECEWMSGHE